MRDTVTLDTFSPHLGQRFRIVADDATTVDIILSSVDVWGGDAPDSSRVPFTLVFHGPKEPVLPQRIYRLEGEALDPLELFLVPVGPDEDGMRYEAVFS